MYRVYDDQTNETLFTSKESHDCAMYIKSNYDAEEGEGKHIWIEQIIDDIFDMIVFNYGLSSTSKDDEYIAALEKEILTLYKENEELKEDVESLQYDIDNM